MWLIWKICFKSHVFKCLLILIHCVWMHLLILWYHCGCIYICLIRCCGALLTWPDQWGATSVLLVSGCTSAVAGVFHWVWVTALGLWAAACLGVVGATDGCTCCTASEVDGVVMGCPATSTLGVSQVWHHLGDIHECGLMLVFTQLHQWLWWCMSHDWLHIL